MNISLVIGPLCRWAPLISRRPSLNSSTHAIDNTSRIAPNFAFAALFLIPPRYRSLLPCGHSLALNFFLSPSSFTL